MTDKQKAEIILQGLEKYINVNEAFRAFYIKGIINGLKQIKEEGINL